MSKLVYGLSHHGKPIWDLAAALAFVCQEQGILWRSRRGGVNSYYFDSPNGRVLIKGVPQRGCIEVRRHEREPVRLDLTSRTQIVAWAEAGFPV